MMAIVGGLLAVMAMTGSAQAQMVLYDPLPPAGSAYVRLVNGLPGAVRAEPDFAPAVTLSADHAHRVEPYRVVENAAGRKLGLAVAGAHLELQVKPGSFNSVVITRQGGAVTALAIEERSEFNQARARLSFDNAIAGCADGKLDLAPGGQNVFADVAAGQSRMRNVNPVEASVRASCGGKAPILVALGALEAGGQYSVWLMAPSGSPEAFVVRDTTAPYRR